MKIDYLLEEVKKVDESCIIYSQNEKQICFKENKSVYVAENKNQKRILGFRIDNGFIKDKNSGDRKCDFALYTEDEVLYLIELKGTKIQESFEQLLKTLDFFSLKYKSINKFLCRSVHSRINTFKLEGERIKHLRKKLIKINKEFYNKNNSYLYYESYKHIDII